MKRIVKHPDVRRVEIINAAEKLFGKNGYNKTPVEAIIKEAGIAKGTFYHYFKTKQDILRAIVENISAQKIEYINAIAMADKLNALQKLKQILNPSEKPPKYVSIVMKIIHKAENRELQEELNILSVKHIAPLIAKILEQGRGEGFFKTKVSVESMQILLAGIQFVLDSGLFSWPNKTRIAFLFSIQTMLENLTAAKPGTLAFIVKK